MASYTEWAYKLSDKELASSLEYHCHLSPSNVTYYVILEAARRLRDRNQE